MPFELGRLVGAPAAEHTDLFAAATLAGLVGSDLLHRVGVVEIDPDVSDTAATQREFGLDPDMLANCVIVAGKRDGQERLAACLVLATTRADINGVVRRRLDVRKASFLPTERAVGLTGMEYGGITPIGLPAAWPVLVDAAVLARPMVVIGSGIRRSKIMLTGALVGTLPSAVVIDGLGLPVGLG